jgi:exodeoxyribonuclease V alpha subunit
VELRGFEPLTSSMQARALDGGALPILSGLLPKARRIPPKTCRASLALSSHKARDLVTVVGHAATISAGEWITASGEWINDRATVSNSRRDFSRPRRRVRSTGSRNISAPG